MQWLSDRVLDSRPRDHGLKPHRRHCVVGLEQDTFILAYYLFNPGKPVPVYLKDCSWDIKNQIKQTKHSIVWVNGFSYKSMYCYNMSCNHICLSNCLNELSPRVFCSDP